ncbi:hypothetical protein [Aquabacterium sp.]|uniref:hypothetical protein n=1 Tax=Aquabacterium sp. TaxID=1872578 RepID=UPI0025C36D35|nr:hypothetical protein [Aquabacterium sp.]
MSAVIEQAALEVGTGIWGAAKWIGGALGGEFTQKRTTGQIIVDAVISMFPVAGEVTAARDCIAITLRMCDDPKAREDTWEWVSLILCLLAIVPVLGGLLKGVGKLLMRAARPSEDLAAVAREILAFLRKSGYGDVYKWMQSLDFAQYQRPVLNAFNELINRLTKSAEFIVKRMGAVLPAGATQYLRELVPELQQIKALGERKIPQGIKDLNALLNRTRAHMVEGTWADITVGHSGVRLMTEEARLATLARDGGTSLGHSAAHKAHFRSTDGWPSLRADRFQQSLPISTFSIKAPIEAITQRPGTTLIRIVDTATLTDPRTIPGRFWTDHLPPNGATWRTECAVKHGWSMNGSYVELKTPTRAELNAKGISVPPDWEGMRIWKGRVAEQIDDKGDAAQATMRLLVGGDIQLFIDFDHPHNAPIREWLKLQVQAKPTHWKDVLLPSEKQA